MKTIYLGKRIRNNGSDLYRMEAGNHIVSGSYTTVLGYVRSTFGGSKLPIESLDGEYNPLYKSELAKFKKIVGGKRDEERKTPEIEPIGEHVYTDQDEWSKEIKRIEEMLKKY